MNGRALLTIAAALAALGLAPPGAMASPWLQRIEPAGIDLDFGTVEVFTTSAPRRITIRNIGGDPPYALQRTLFGAYQIVAVSGSLAPGDSQSWDLVATPGTEELTNCGGAFYLEWQDHPGGDDRTLQVFLDCTAVPGPYQGPPSPAFGHVAVGTSTLLTFPVTNTSAAPRTITSLSMDTAPFTVALHGGGLPITVPPGGTFEVDVTFAPPAPDPHAANLQITDGDGPHFGFRVIGHGAPAPQVALSASELSFGDVFRRPRAPPSAALQLTNVGSVVAMIPAAAITGAGFAIASGPPPGPLQPQEAVTFWIAFDPDAVGSYAGALELGALGQVALSGRGVLRPVSAAAELDLGAAELGSGVRRSIAIHNAAAVELLVSEIAISSEGGDARFHVVPTDRAIPPGGELGVEIDYEPAAVGADQAELAIAFDADPEPQVFVVLRGTGVAPKEAQGTSGAAGLPGRHPVTCRRRPGDRLAEPPTTGGARASSCSRPSARAGAARRAPPAP